MPSKRGSRSMEPMMIGQPISFRWSKHVKARIWSGLAILKWMDSTCLNNLWRIQSLVICLLATRISIACLNIQGSLFCKLTMDDNGWKWMNMVLWKHHFLCAMDKWTDLDFKKVQLSYPFIIVRNPAAVSSTGMAVTWASMPQCYKQKDHTRPSSAMGENQFCLDFTCQTSQAR